MPTELSTERLYLRQLGPADLEPVYAAIIESFPELNRWLSWAHDGYKKEETIAFLESRKDELEETGACGFGIFDKTSGEFLGGIGIHNVERINGLCNLGYWMKTSATGRGITSEAARRVCEFALTEVGLQRVEIVAAVDNLASRRVAEKIGAVLEGVARKRLLIRGEARDAAIYSMIAEDLTNKNT
jgi:RimJ/RimL family protein N-acetyltransferase